MGVGANLTVFPHLVRQLIFLMKCYILITYYRKKTQKGPIHHCIALTSRTKQKANRQRKPVRSYLHRSCNSDYYIISLDICVVFRSNSQSFLNNQFNKSMRKWVNTIRVCSLRIYLTRSRGETIWWNPATQVVPREIERRARYNLASNIQALFNSIIISSLETSAF